MQQQAEQLLAKAVENRTDIMRGATERLKEHAAQLQRITTIGDETTLAIQRNAIAMGANEQQAKNLALASANLAAATGKDVNSAAQQLTKTLGGYAGELGEVMPEMKAFTAEQLRAGAAIDVVNQKFRGFAESDAKTAAGRLKQLSNEIGDTFELLGERIVHAFAGDSQFTALDALNDKLRILNDNIKAVLEARKQLGSNAPITAPAPAEILSGERDPTVREMLQFPLSRGIPRAISGFTAALFGGASLPERPSFPASRLTDDQAFQARIRQMIEESQKRQRETAAIGLGLRLRNSAGPEGVDGFMRSLISGGREAVKGLGETLRDGVRGMFDQINDRNLLEADREARDRRNASLRASIMLAQSDVNLAALGIGVGDREQRDRQSAQDLRRGVASQSFRFLTREPGSGSERLTIGLMRQGNKENIEQTKLLRSAVDDLDAIRENSGNQFSIMSAPAA